MKRQLSYHSLELYMLKSMIHIKPKSYKFELLGELVIYMISEFGIAGGLGFETSLYNLFPIY